MGGCEGTSALVVKSMCPFTSQKCPFIPRIVILFSRKAFLFLGIAHLFPGIVLLFSRSAFLKNAVVFHNCPLVFQKCLFIYCVFLFPKMLFSPADGSFSSSCSELLRDNICLILLLFPLGTLYWPTYDVFLITLKLLQWVWFFM